MSPRLAPALIALLCLSAPLSWLVAEEPTPPAVANPANAGVQAEAEAKANAGRKALQTYRKDQAGNPNAVVDAAVAFTEAHKLYAQIGDIDSVSEMQANIYWCKKQMNLDAVKTYLAREGKTEALAEMTVVADKKVETNEAQQYLDRAKKFAADHSTDLNGISIRYFEVAERFVGTPVGLEAQKLSLDAQNKFMQWLQSGGLARETRFTKPVVVQSGSRVAIPEDKDQKSTIAELKKLYAKDYSQRTDAQKRRFATKLFNEAGKSKGDAITYFTLLNEVCRLSQEAEDYERLLDTIDVMAGSFTGYDASEQKKAWMKRLTGKPTAAAIATLLDKPQDPPANVIAGKFFCFQLNRWEQGLPMLANGNDAELKAVGEQELSKPESDAQRVQVGDAWYQATKKGGPSSEKYAMLTRAQHWYQSARGVTGVLKERVSQRLVEIDKTLPLDPDNIDYTSLTPTQWSKLKGTETVVQARVDRTGPVMSLKPGQHIRVVPHPTDSWTCQSWTGSVTCTATGSETGGGNNRRARDRELNGAFLGYDAPYQTGRFGELLMQVDKGETMSCGIAVGPGPVWVMPNAPAGERKGQIRIKLVAVDDE